MFTWSHCSSKLCQQWEIERTSKSKNIKHLNNVWPRLTERRVKKRKWARWELTEASRHTLTGGKIRGFSWRNNGAVNNWGCPAMRELQLTWTWYFTHFLLTTPVPEIIETLPLNRTWTCPPAARIDGHWSGSLLDCWGHYHCCLHRSREKCVCVCPGPSWQ